MLASKCRLHSIGLARVFCQLSEEDVAIRLQPLAAGQEILHKSQGDASNAWEELYMHVTKFDAKLGMYLGDANKGMMDKAMEIWMHIQAVAPALDMTPDVHLGLTLFLLDWLPMISPGLSFQQDIPSSLMQRPEAITFQKKAGTSHSTPPVPDDSGDAKSNTKASLPLAQVGQATPRSHGMVPNKNSLDEPGEPVPQITLDFEKALPLKHSSLVKAMQLIQESTTDIEFPKKPQKDDSNSKRSTSSESGAEEDWACREWQWRC